MSFHSSWTHSKLNGYTFVSQPLNYMMVNLMFAGRKRLTLIGGVVQ